MKTIIWLAVISCLLLAAFLWFRPVVGELGKPVAPDATGRARRPVPDGASAGAAPTPAPGASPSPTAGAASAAGITHPEALEKKILEMTNAARAEKGVPALEPEPTLVEVARGHSDDMLVRGFFEHVNPDGLADSDRVAIRHRRLIGLTGENIWMSTGPGAGDIDKLAYAMMYGERGWMNSPGHRANILRPEYTHLGVGVSVRGGEVRATQNFAYVRAFAARDIPPRVDGGASLDLSSTPFKPDAPAVMYDYWVPGRGVNTGASYEVADGTVRPPAGVYKLRFYFPSGAAADDSAAYTIYGGPQIEVR